MAITPRSLLRSPLVLFLALASLGVVVLGGAAFFTVGWCPSQQSTRCPRYRQAPQPDLFTMLRSGPCARSLAARPTSLERWEQRDWESLLSCLDDIGDSRNAVRVADRGLDYFPKAESIYNVKAFHEMELRRFDLAVETLETGLAQIGTPSNGVLENNLAWANLWLGRDIQRARALYQRSLRRDPTRCEAIHTGMWTEYAIAAHFPPSMRKQAYDNYRELRNDYGRCTGNRLDYGPDEVVSEVLGAGVLDHEMERLEAAEQRGEPARLAAISESALVDAAVGEAFEREMSFTAEPLCEESVPVSSALHACSVLVQGQVIRHTLPSVKRAR